MQWQIWTKIYIHYRPFFLMNVCSKLCSSICSFFLTVCSFCTSAWSSELNKQLSLYTNWWVWTFYHNSAWQHHHVWLPSYTIIFLWLAICLEQKRGNSALFYHMHNNILLILTTACKHFLPCDAYASCGICYSQTCNKSSNLPSPSPWLPSLSHCQCQYKFL